MTDENQYITKMQHRYQSGQRVRCTNPKHVMYQQCGSVDRAMPYAFELPAYDVLFDGSGRITAMSERSLEALCNSGKLPESLAIEEG